MEKLKAFAHKNPVRVAAFVSSAVALIVSIVVPDVPVEAAVAFVLSALGLGEYAQRVENVKTDVALHADIEDLDNEEA
jgi:hypothetical protein